MKKKFYIAEAHQTLAVNLVHGKKKVSEEIFFETLEAKIKKITASRPEKYEETLETVKKHLSNIKPINITVDDKWFGVEPGK